MMDQLPFDASEIDNWADTLDARGRLSELVYHMIMETVSMPHFIEMPSGSSVTHGGWDGLLEVECGNAWVPTGTSAWEFSCRKDIAAKASEEYEKRTKNPKGVVTSTSTFVFVTARRWSGKGEWAQQRREEGEWANVRAWDADSLVGWLRQAPKASRWYADVIDQRFPALERRREALRAEGDRGDIANQLIGDLRTSLPGLFSEALSQAGAAQTEEDHDPVHCHLGERIDFARSLIDRGLPASAREELQQLKKDTEKIPDDFKFRILTNLAACSYVEEEITKTCDLLENAYRLQPGNPKAIANAALAAHLKGDSDHAVELAYKARELTPQDSQATSVLLWEFFERGEAERLEELLAAETWIAQDPQCLLLVAEIRMQQSRFEEAYATYRSRVGEAPEDYDAHLALSQCLLNSFYAGSLPTDYDNNSLKLLNEAETEATLALELLDQTQLDARRHAARIIRAGARILLGKNEDATRDLDTVLGKVPDHPHATYNKGLLLLKNGHPAEARRLLESIQDRQLRADAIVPLADACHETGDTAAVVELLKGTVSLDSPSWEEVRGAELLLRAEMKIGLEDSVGPVLKYALSQNPNDSRLLTLAAARSQLINDAEAAESFLIKAIEHASDDDRQMIQTQLGALYEGEERFTEAAAIFGLAMGNNLSHPAAIPFLTSLANSGQQRQALDLARRIRAHNCQIPRVVFEVEAQILDYAGDFYSLVMRLEDLCARADATSIDWVRLAVAQFRSGRRSDALKTISLIDVSNLADDPVSVLKVAQMKRMLGDPQYLHDAYMARRYGMDVADVHIGYFQLFVGMDDELDHPDTVEPGCAVRVKDDEEERWWLLLAEGEQPYGPHELAVGEELAQRLLGKRIGEIVALRGGPEELEELSYEITDLQSKFVRAFQETINEFSTRFPRNMALSRVRIEADNFAKVFQMVDRRDQFVRNAENLYKTNRLPFATFAKIIGSSPLEIWRAYAEDPSASIRFGTGTDEEMAGALDALRGARCIVLDMVALLTAHHLGLAESLKERFEHVAVPQKVIDDLQNIVCSLVIHGKPSSYMGREDGGAYTLADLADATWTDWRNYAFSVLELAESFDRIPSYPMLDIDNADQLSNVLTDAGVGAIYAGDESTPSGQVLVSDDLVQSTVAQSLGVVSVNSQSLLDELRRSSDITDEEYSCWIEKLALLNYQLVRVRSEDIVRRLEASAYVTTKGSRAMFNTLEGPDCPEDVATSVSAEVIASLIGRAVPEEIELLLPFVLSILGRGRPAKQAHRRFREEVSRRLSPVERRWILPAIDLYI